MTYASAARLRTFPPATPAGSSPPHIADNDPSSATGARKADAFIEGLENAVIFTGFFVAAVGCILWVFG